MITVEQLCIRLAGNALVDIAFEIRDALALVGQSGSGKSLTLKALLDMLPSGMQRQLEVTAPFALKRGDSVAFVPQNPFTALSPLTRIRGHFDGMAPEAVFELFRQVELDPALLKRFPPELSGGQLQRVVIAIALSHAPRLMLLDEPTTALDPKTRSVIIELLKKLQKRMGFQILFVTHDIVSARALCEDVCVIKEGRMVEKGTMETVLNHPAEHYTKTLIEASFATREFRR